MSDSLAGILVTVAVILALISLWALGIVYVYWHTGRRDLPGWERALWVLLALVPLVGLAAYVMALSLSFLFPERASNAAGGPRRRVTLLKPLPGAPARLPTFLAADLRQQTVASVQDPAAAAEPQACLLSVLEGPHAGQTFTVKRLPARIGRSARAAVRLDRDKNVSRQHAELYLQDGVLQLRDLDSSHGTTVNGERIDAAAVRPGDRIRVGSTVLALQQAGPAG